MTGFTQWWTGPLGVRSRIESAWLVLRMEQGRGATAALIRGRAWRALLDAYATEAGASIGPGERMLLAGSVWPSRNDE